VKVLDDLGYGQTSDVIAAIDWVIYHAREFNIRVMNLSLASDSTESWQTDPLARAVRSASAAGITVVVAAGNFGKGSGPGAGEIYGTISSPGHEPSVITVGELQGHRRPQRRHRERLQLTRADAGLTRRRPRRAPR
jgi:serine protease AprX